MIQKSEALNMSRIFEADDVGVVYLLLIIYGKNLKG